jgi:hypothetical protein
MFIGHYAVALAAKKAAPKTSLGTLVLAAQFVDLLWPLLLLLGLEQARIDPGNTAFSPLDFSSYPYSHSLLAGVVWSVVFSGLYFALRRDRRGALVVGLCVISHWVLDFLTHRPDLPLWFGGPKVGLGLWNSIGGTLLLEGTLFTLGVAVYWKATQKKDRIGSYGFWGLVGVLLLLYIVSVSAAPPPGIREVAIVGNASWLFVLWAYWVDRHRTIVAGGARLDA